MEKYREHKPRARVYLDLETYRPKDEGSFTDEDIILIGLIVEPVDNLANQKEEYKPFKNFEKEHEKRLQKEKEILKEFYGYLKELQKRYYVEIIGFYNLRYDIPLIISKTLKHNIVKDVFDIELKKEGGKAGRSVHDAEFINKWWHEIYTIDLAQLLLPFNNFVFKGLKLEAAVGLSNKVFKCEIETKTPGLSGKDIVKLFESGLLNENFNEIVKKIEEKNKADLKFIKNIYLCLKKKYKFIVKQLTEKPTEKN
ncbi:MAG: hypothetical protein QW579_05225 [Desulfurococcaceae archaeon]